jgi:hypothetical protein
MTPFARLLAALLILLAAPLRAGDGPFEPDGFDFGEITVGQSSAPQVFTYANTDVETRTITSVVIGGFAPSHYTLVDTTCMGDLAPGGSCTVTVRFSPLATGSQVALIRLAFTQPSQPLGEANAGLFGTGIPEGGIGVPTLAPTPHDYGNVQVGASSVAQVFTLTNGSDESITIASVQLGGAAPDQYTLGANTCAGVVAPGGECTIGVSFTPSAVGSQVALLRVSYSAPSIVGQAELNATLSGTGTGVAAPAQPVPATGIVALVFAVALVLLGAAVSARRDPLAR